MVTDSNLFKATVMYIADNLFHQNAVLKTFSLTSNRP